MSWLEGWKYRQAVPINGSPDGELTDFQKYLVVKKKVGESSPGEVYLNDHCRDDFGDVRFTKSDGITELDYWLEDIQAHFANIGCSAPLYPNISPVAIYHDSKTYVVFQGTGFHPFITTYTHATGVWAAPIQVGTNPLSGDDHGAPSLLRDVNGYWHIFFGCHNTAIEHVKSNNPDDISAWTAQADVAVTASYQCPVLASNGDIYLFFRGYISTTDYPLYYVVSVDNGASWNTAQKIIDFSSVSNRIYHGNYELETGTPEKIHFVWSYSDGADSWRRNVYHADLIITGVDTGKLFSIGGTDLGTTITKTEADASCLVYNSGTNNCVFPKIHVYSGIPHIIFPLDNGTTPQNFQHIKWNGSSWDSPATISAVPSHVRYGGCLDFIVSGGSNVEAYLTVGATGYSNYGGMIEKWLWNGSSWSKSKVIMPAFEWDGLVNPWAIKGYQTDLKIIFCERYAGNYVDGLRLFAHGDQGIKASVDVQAAFMIELDNIPADPDIGEFYIYYGKSSALTSSNGVNTFIFFDHFVGSALDTDKWNNNTNVADMLAVLNNELKWSIADSGAARAVPGIDSKNLTFTLPMKIESRWRVDFNGPTGGSTSTAVRSSRAIHPTANTHWTVDSGYFIGYAAWRDLSPNDWLNCVGTGGASVDNDVIDNIRIRESLHFKSGASKQYRNEILEISDANTSALASGYFGLQYYIEPEAAIGTQEIFIDFVGIRKYTDNEPTWGIPGEEEEAPPVPGGGTSFVVWIN